MKKTNLIISLLCSSMFTIHAATSTITIPDTFYVQPHLDNATALRLTGMGYAGTGLGIVVATTASALLLSHKNNIQQKKPSIEQIVTHIAAAVIGGWLSWYGTGLLEATLHVPKD